MNECLLCFNRAPFEHTHLDNGVLLGSARRIHKIARIEPKEALSTFIFRHLQHLDHTTWLADKFNISGHLPSAGPVWLPAAARRSPVWGRGPGRARRWQRHTRPGDIVAQANASRS